MKLHRVVFLFPFILFLYSIWSYTQVAPNLVLSSNPLYWQIQQWFWQLGYHNRPLSTLLFIVIMLLSFGLYLWLLRLIRNKLLFTRDLVVLFVLCIGALLPSYPALSNDIFNYLMNAKMMHVYQASPYTHAAWDFPNEPWLSFMMNVHTTTPYGYVWTGVGYVLYWFSGGYLQLGMLLFRLLAIAAVTMVSVGVWLFSTNDRLFRVSLFVFNPLVLFEAISNTHNDMLMMGFFILGIGITKYYFLQKKYLLGWLILLAGWTLSVFTKLVTVIAPIVVSGSWVISRRWKTFYWADWLGLAFIVAMFADSSSRFYPWYLLWAIAVMPLTQSVLIRRLLMMFSFSGMMSYIFFLYTGEYTDYLGSLRIGLLFSLPIMHLISTLFRNGFLYRKSQLNRGKQ